MTSFDFPDTLLAAAHASWEAIQAGTLTQDGVTEFANEGGHNRHEVEMALKKAVRHPATEG